MDRFASMETFVRVVEAGGFAAAARHLRLSPTMVSKHLANLEARLGTRLLHRTTRRVALTDAGRAFYERCRLVLREVDEMERAATSQQTRPEGLLRVAAPVAFTESHLAPLLAAFARAHPAVSLDVSCDDRVVDLVEGGYDMAIRLGKLPDSSLVARRLAPAHVVVCAAPSYLSERGTPETLDDLSRHLCLGYTYQWTGESWGFRSDSGEDATIPLGRMAHRTNNAQVQRALAIDGCGIAQLPAYVVGHDLRAGRLVALLTRYKPLERWIHAVYPPGRHLPATVRALIDFLAERFRTPPWEPAA